MVDSEGEVSVETSLFRNSLRDIRRGNLQSKPTDTDVWQYNAKERNVDINKF